MAGPIWLEVFGHLTFEEVAFHPPAVQSAFELSAPEWARFLAAKASFMKLSNIFLAGAF
jgi:hypothetical protein